MGSKGLDPFISLLIRFTFKQDDECYLSIQLNYTAAMLYVPSIKGNNKYIFRIKYRDYSKFGYYLVTKKCNLVKFDDPNRSLC